MHEREKKAIGKPSLWVTLPLTAPIFPQTCLSHSSQSGDERSRAYGSSSHYLRPLCLRPLSCLRPALSNKRRTALIADDDESDLFTPSSSREQAPKKQRFQPPAPKPRATPEAKVTTKSHDDDRPEPRGQPEVWADVWSMTAIG